VRHLNEHKDADNNGVVDRGRVRMTKRVEGDQAQLLSMAVVLEVDDIVGTHSHAV
jgi:hypothetical protein